MGGGAVAGGCAGFYGWVWACTTPVGSAIFWCLISRSAKGCKRPYVRNATSGCFHPEQTISLRDHQLRESLLNTRCFTSLSLLTSGELNLDV